MDKINGCVGLDIIVDDAKVMKTCSWKDIGLGPVVQCAISANLGLPINQWFWFRLFWLNNLVQVS